MHEKNTNKFADEQVVSLLENAALLYADENINNLNDLKTKNVQTITVNDLINAGYVKQSNLKNVSTSEIVLIANVDEKIKTKFLMEV